MDTKSLKPILDTQEEHTAILNRLRENTSSLDKRYSALKTTLDEHSATLDEHSRILNQHTHILDEHSRILNQHTHILDEHSRILNQHTHILNEHSEELASIHRSLVVIEDAVTNKIPALFDAFLANQEKHEEYDKQIDHLETVTQKNSIRISVLEHTSQMHSKKFEKLSS